MVLSARQSNHHDDEKERYEKRVYFRKKQREHREKNKSRQMMMQRKIEAMEAILNDAKSNGRKPLKLRRRNDLLLGWDIISNVMKQERDKSEKEQIHLRTQLKESTSVLQDMQRFAALNIGIPERSSWRYFTLFSNPESRRLGKSWISTQMYYNTERYFRQYGFPSPDSSDRFQEYDIVFADECYYLIQRSHIYFDVPMEAFRRLNQRHLCSLLLLAGCSSQDIETGESDMRRQVTGLGECVNLLLGEFHEGNKCTHVVQQIQNDELWTHSYPQRNRSTWIELTRIAPSRTMVRALSIISQSRTQAGYLSMENEVNMLELDKAQALASEDGFRRQFLARTKRNTNPVKQDIPTILAELVAELKFEENDDQLHEKCHRRVIN